MDTSSFASYSPEPKPQPARLKHGLIQSSFIDMKAERSLETIDRTLKNFDTQLHLNEVVERKNLQEFSGKYKELVLRTKNRIRERN